MNNLNWYYFMYMMFGLLKNKNKYKFLWQIFIFNTWFRLMCYLISIQTHLFFAFEVIGELGNINFFKFSIMVNFYHTQPDIHYSCCSVFLQPVDIAFIFLFLYYLIGVISERNIISVLKLLRIHGFLSNLLVVGCWGVFN